MDIELIKNQILELDEKLDTIRRSLWLRRKRKKNKQPRRNDEYTKFLG